MSSLFSKRSVLRRMKIRSVDAVDKGAQEGSRIFLRKRAPGATRVRLSKSHVDMPNKTFWGIAVTSTINGQPYFDLQGDHVPVDELQKAADDFMQNSRNSGALHLMDPTTGKDLAAGKVVQSLVVDADVAKGLGIDLPDGRECWIIKVRVDDAHVLRMVEASGLAELSIGGSGMRTPVEKTMTNDFEEIAKSMTPEARAAFDELVQLGSVGLVTDAVIEKARDAGALHDGSASNEELVAIFNQIDPAAITKMVMRCQAEPASKGETLIDYAKRVTGGQPVSEQEQGIIAMAHAQVKHQHKLLKKREHETNRIVRKAGAQLEELAKSIAAAEGLTAARDSRKLASGIPISIEP